MNDHVQENPSTIAPADARPHRPWRRSAKIAAYLILTLLALLAVWFIDRRVDAVGSW